jgi:hypothetical protein
MQVGCLSIQDQIIDATSEEGKRYLSEMEGAVVEDVEATGSAKAATS